MKKRARFIIGAVLALGLMASTAIAGYSLTQPTMVWSNGMNTFAVGVLSAARASANDIEYIGCSDYGTMALCQAKDSAGDSFYCSTTEAEHLASIRSIGEHTRLYLIANSSSACLTVFVYNTSNYIP